MSSPANPDVYAFRWGSNVADANTPTYLANNSTTIEVLLADLDSTVFYIYMGIENDGDMSASSAYSLQHDSGSDTWVSITSSSAYVRTVAGADTDADAITSTPSDFTDGAGSFVNGEYNDVSPSETGANLGAGLHSVHVYSVQFQGADLSGGETVNFRLRHGGAEVSNDVVATCTIEAASGDVDINTTSPQALVISTKTATLTHNVVITTGSPQALVVATHTATIAFDANIATGSPQALVVAEKTATITHDVNIATGSPQALVVATHTATIAYGVDIQTNAPQALLLTEHVATITHNVNIATASPQALVVAEKTASLSHPVDINTGSPQALVITTHTATIAAGSNDVDIATNAPQALVLTEKTASITHDVNIATTSPQALSITTHAATIEIGSSDVVITRATPGFFFQQPKLSEAGVEELLRAFLDKVA